MPPCPALTLLKTHQTWNAKQTLLAVANSICHCQLQSQYDIHQQMGLATLIWQRIHLTIFNLSGGHMGEGMARTLANDK